MTLAREYEHLFRPSTIELGDQIFAYGGILNLRSSRGLHRARVDGISRIHQAFFDTRTGRPGCTCQANAKNQGCKHVWALLRAVEEASEDHVDWRAGLRDLRRQQRDLPPPADGSVRVLYLIDVSGPGNIPLHAVLQRRLKNGRWSKPKDLRQDEEHPIGAEDRRLMGFLEGARRYRSYGFHDPHTWDSLHVELSADSLTALLPDLAATGRAHLGNKHAFDDEPVTVDEGGAWTAVVALDATAPGGLSRSIERAGERLDPDSIHCFIRGGWLLSGRVFRRLEPEDAFAWMPWIENSGIAVEPGEFDDFFVEAQSTPLADRLAPPAGWTVVAGSEVPPTPVVALEPHARGALKARPLFSYGGSDRRSAGGRRTVDAAARRVIECDREEEARRLAEFAAAGDSPPDEKGRLTVLAADVPRFVGRFLELGWRAEVEGTLMRKSTGSRSRVRSAQDWFDLEGGVTFGEEEVPFPRLLEAARGGRTTITLGDGSRGVLPEEWLRRCGLLGEAEEHDGGLRFRRNQGLLLDLLLESAPAPDLDRQFETMREELASFERIEPAAEPHGFVGELRPYQREGLGWLGFLDRFGFGGCLADDMGLGKTIQILAWLLHRRDAEGGAGPTLVVAPKSVVPNWITEAARFAPALTVVDYTGTERAARLEDVPAADLVVTSYGLVRRDVETLRAIRFGAVVLDEAQAIKNARSQTSKACRLLDCDRRLALSGTPIENHIDELWSLFEFLNPGMFGSMELLRELGEGDDAARKDLAHLLAPFILRRRKEEVATDLPQRVEQTLTCTLPAKQRKLYDELLVHYRSLLADKIETDGLQKSKMHVLTALTRLRQAACHPGLIDRDRCRVPAAKVDTLLERIGEVVAEGHKALVFSQFTKFLGIVKQRLDEHGIAYEYLDGRTRKRQEKIDRFQAPDGPPAFLISLKAGGTGLNLTAADYVFLLDPWWNPAVEAQAIDRTHRIGQTRQVIAYRLIAENTIEEKILALQDDKRELARSILDNGSRTLRDLTREDLERLLA